MAHGIGINDKQQGREMAWHGLTEVSENLTLDNCWLGQWDVKPEAMEINGRDSGFKILVATDDEQIIVGKPYNDQTYTVIYNETVLDMVRQAALDLPLESCGSIHDRSKTFLSFSVNEAQLQIEHREFEAFLNFGNSFDASSPFWVNTSNFCTVCANTFNANLHDKDAKKVQVKIRHTKNAMNSIDNMPEIIQAAVYTQREFGRKFNELMTQKATREQARLWFTGFMVPNGAEQISTRTENIIDRLTSLFSTGRGNEGQNWADVFSAMTEYHTHESSGGDDKWKQFVSSEFGTASMRKQGAWVAITDIDHRNEIIRRGKTF